MDPQWSHGPLFCLYKWWEILFYIGVGCLQKLGPEIKSVQNVWRFHPVQDSWVYPNYYLWSLFPSVVDEPSKKASYKYVISKWQWPAPELSWQEQTFLLLSTHYEEGSYLKGNTGKPSPKTYIEKCTATALKKAAMCVKRTSNVHQAHFKHTSSEL